MGLVLARSSDAAIVVVQAERTRRPVVRRLVDLLRQTGAPVAGTVLNRAGTTSRASSTTGSSRWPAPPGPVRTRAVARRAGSSPARSRLVDETWAVGLVDRPIASFLERPSLADARWLAPPRGGYRADPFGLPDGETILVERFDHADRSRPPRGDRPRRGRAAIRSRSTGRPSGTPRSRSSPRARTVPSSACPRPWPRAARPLAPGPGRPVPAVATVAADLMAADPTLFFWDGRWWIAFADARLGAADNLCLLHAATLRAAGGRTAGNPVKRDLGSSRPAGTPFVHDGQLYRPAQDCDRLLRCGDRRQPGADPRPRAVRRGAGGADRARIPRARSRTAPTRWSPGASGPWSTPSGTASSPPLSAAGRSRRLAPLLATPASPRGPGEITA